jgi:PAS domain S-box-containing protein
VREARAKRNQDPFSAPATTWRLHWAVPVVLTLLLIALRTLSYPAFHLLVELFTIIIAVSTFVVAWNTFPFSRNGFLLFVGLGFFWVAAIDLAHTLTYKGMNVLPVLTANPPTQLWIAARYSQAFLLLIAPLFLQRSFPRGLTFTLLGAIAIGLIATVAGGLFPDCFVEGEGLTRFKVLSEYLIASLLALALAHVWIRRALLDRRLLAVIATAIVFTIFSELAFTLYVDVYGIANLVGHLFKLFAFWLFYVALVEWSLTRPFVSLAHGANTYDAVPDPTIVVDWEGIIRQVNEVVRTQPDLPAGIEGQHVHDLFHPRALSRDACPVCRAIRNGETLQRAELERPEIGRWFEVTLSPIHRAGEYAGAIHVARDITPQKNALLDLEHTLRRLRETQEQIIQSEKLSALGIMSAGIAHELNNPLMGIDNYLDYAEKNTEGRTREILGRARRELVRVQEILQNVLAYAGPAQVHTGPVDAHEALERALQLIASDLRSAHIEVRREFLELLPTVCARLDGLQQVFINLLLNARDAMADSPQKILTLRATVEDYCWVSMQVEDTGIGMDEAVRHRIFDPFFTTKPPGVGTGLGLLVSLNLITGFGGTLTCESQPGVGTTFTIRLKRCS